MLKNWIQRGLVGSGVTRLVGRLAGPGVAILMYHSVMDDPFEVAMPVLDQTGVPAAFYVVVDCIENARLPWPARLRYAFYTTKRSTWAESNGTLWPLKSFEQRDAAFLKACDDCCQLGGARQEQFVRGIESDLDAEFRSAENPMMTWDQLGGLTRKGHT